MQATTATSTPRWIVKGWTFDPIHQEWTKRIGPSTWLVSKVAP